MFWVWGGLLWDGVGTRVKKGPKTLLRDVIRQGGGKKQSTKGRNEQYMTYMDGYHSCVVRTMPCCLQLASKNATPIHDRRESPEGIKRGSITSQYDVNKDPYQRVFIHHI